MELAAKSSKANRMILSDFIILNILIVMETKIDSNKPHLIIQNLKMPNYIEIPSKGFSGGILLLWKNITDFSPETIINKRFIHSRIRDNNRSVSWFRTFIYDYLSPKKLAVGGGPSRTFNTPSQVQPECT